MVERKLKLFLYFYISATIFYSLSINGIENIIVPCGSSHTIHIQEYFSSWISSSWTFERNNGIGFILLDFESDEEEYRSLNSIYRETLFILDYGVHYLSLYQMSILLNNSIITFKSYQKKEKKGKTIFDRE
ncbi:hypothetical protein HZS_4185 [Henneguya salminicola]|nr:hypothetical protein HZS_4185 [Henneguya salminicola]